MIFIEQGDITARSDDAIVNAANSALMPGGGVCGAIHSKAGSGLAKECAEIGECPTGSAVITKGYNLKAKHVIHTVGPIWRGGASGEAELLEGCYRSVFKLVEKNGLGSVALPAISTGIFGYPLEEATEIAIKAAKEFEAATGGRVDITFMCFDKNSYEAYISKL